MTVAEIKMAESLLKQAIVLFEKDIDRLRSRNLAMAPYRLRKG